MLLAISLVLIISLIGRKVQKDGDNITILYSLTRIKYVIMFLFCYLGYRIVSFILSSNKLGLVFACVILTLFMINVKREDVTLTSEKIE